CPFDLLYVDDDGFPALRRAAKKHCIACGHCVTVCPRGALRLRLLPEGDTPDIDPALIPSPEQVEQFIKSRRSIRSFKKKPVPKKTMLRLLDTARYAPSAKNAQPVRWRVYNDPARIQELAGLVVAWMAEHRLYPGVVRAWENGEDKVLRHAPHLVLAYAPVDSADPAADCSIAATYLELAAHAHGIGACWAGFLMNAAERFEPVIRALNLPEGMRAYAALMLGYPKFKYVRIPARNPLQVEFIG
ncbi:MAG: nitroreductase family protein, partial [Desulfovibrionaceae bacterium]